MGRRSKRRHVRGHVYHSWKDPEGSGKSTQIRHLAAALREQDTELSKPENRVERS